MKFSRVENVGKWAVRFLILAAALLSLIGLSWKSKPKAREWVVILDISDSVRLVHERSGSDLRAFYRNKIVKLAGKMNTEDRIAVVYFGKGAQIAMPLSKTKEIRLLPPSIAGASSEIIRGMHLALALFTGTRRACVVIFTDGNISLQTQGKIAKLAAKHNLQITLQSALPDGSNQFPDASLKSLVMPDVARKNVDVAGYAEVEVSKAGKFQVSIASKGRVWSSQMVQAYAPGNFRAYFSLPAEASEKQKISASVSSLSFLDRCPENDTCWKEINIEQKPHILWIGRGENLSSRFRITRVNASQARGEIGNLEQYHAIVVSEGNSDVLSDVLPALERYVLHGGGLLVIAGPSTLGPGGYAGTALETALPVWCAPENKSPAVLLVMLDISGSMGEAGKETAKLQQAKIALAQALEVLSDSDSFSLLTFHSEAKIAIPFANYREIRESLARELQKIYAQGGTKLLPALQIALECFKAEFPGRKHILLVSDGLSRERPEQILNLVGKLRSRGITLSVIATGDNSGKILRKMAQNGGGKFYLASQTQLSSFLKNDIKLVKGDLLSSSAQKITDIKNGLLQQDLAEFRGAIIQKLARTSPKSWGRVLLETTRKTPVLVLGNYGLGRSVVLATNLSMQWGGTLAENGQMLLENILSWLVSPYFSAWDFKMVLDKGKVRAVLHTEKRGKFRAISSWHVGPSALKERDYGLYSGTFSAPGVGVHKVVLQEYAAGEWISRKVSKMIVPYPDEYRKLGFHGFELPAPIAHNTSWPLASFFLACSISLFILERIWHFLRS